MTDISSTSVSWRTVRDVMTTYHEGLPVEQFSRPPGLVEAELCAPSGLVATASCPIKNPPDLFVADRLPSAEDDWWVVAQIDSRTNKLASEFTPAEFIEERLFLQLPDGLGPWETNQALEWAEELEDASSEDVPTETTDVRDLPMAITSPTTAEQVSGDVVVEGRAFSESFVSYRLEYRYDTLPGDWQPIIEVQNSVPEGVLGIWTTDGLPLGLYTLRLVVNDEALGEDEQRVQVLLVGAAELDPDNSSEADPDEPEDGES